MPLQPSTFTQTFDAWFPNTTERSSVTQKKIRALLMLTSWLYNSILGEKPAPCYEEERKAIARSATLRLRCIPTFHSVFQFTARCIIKTAFFLSTCCAQIAMSPAHNEQ